MSINIIYQLGQDVKSARKIFYQNVLGIVNIKCSELPGWHQEVKLYCQVAHYLEQVFRKNIAQLERLERSKGLEVRPLNTNYNFKAIVSLQNALHCLSNQLNLLTIRQGKTFKVYNGKGWLENYLGSVKVNDSEIISDEKLSYELLNHQSILLNQLTSDIATGETEIETDKYIVNSEILKELLTKENWNKEDFETADNLFIEITDKLLNENIKWTPSWYELKTILRQKRKELIEEKNENDDAPGELILKGYLAPPVYYSVDGIDLKGVQTVAGDFNKSDLGVRCNTPEVVNTIVKEWKRLASNRLTIAFAVNIAHTKAIATAFNEVGVRAASVNGTMPTKQREVIYSQLQSGQIKVVASCEALGEGFDIPAISCVLLCRPSKSKAKAWQQIGRGLRISLGKYDCLILDQAGMVTRFGFVEDLKSFILGKSEKTPLGAAPTKICPKCSAINRNFDKVCSCCGYEYLVVPKLVPTKEFKLLRCTADKVKQYQHYHELLKESYHRGFKPVWADNQYYSHYKQWPPYKWMRDAIFGNQPTLADKIAYRQYLVRLMVADRQAIGWVNHHMRMIFGEDYSMQ